MMKFKEALINITMVVFMFYVFLTIIAWLFQVDPHMGTGGLTLVEYIHTQIEWFKLIRIY